MSSHILPYLFSLILPLDLRRIVIIAMSLLNLHAIFPQTRSYYASCNELYNFTNGTMNFTNITTTSTIITKITQNYVYDINITFENLEHSNITENFLDSSIYLQNITSEQDDNITTNINNSLTIINGTLSIPVFDPIKFNKSINITENSIQNENTTSFGKIMKNQTIEVTTILIDMAVNKLVFIIYILKI